MPTRTEKVTGAAPAQGMTNMEKAVANNEAGPATNTNSKSALQKKLEDFMTQSKVKWGTIEERTVQAEGRKVQVCFVDFPAGKGKASIMEMLYNVVAYNNVAGYSVEVEPEEEVLLFFKG